MSTKKNFLSYMALSYFDKAITIASPLILIKFFNDTEIYNMVEYILSISLIVSNIIDFGLSKYYFYGFRQEKDKQEFLNSIESGFSLILTVQVLIVIILLFSHTTFPNTKLAVAIGIRGIFLAFVTFKLNSYRVKEKPHLIFLWSIPASLLSILILYFGFTYHKHDYLYFFLGLLLFEIIYVILEIRKYILRVNITTLLRIFKTAVSFSWPMVITVFILSYVLNYGKIYVFENMDQSQMTIFSLMQRFMTVIVLAHSSAASFFLKDIFTKETIKMDKRVFMNYTQIILFSIFLLLVAVTINNKFNILGKIPINETFGLLTLFYILNSYAAFISTYFSVLNKNRDRLIACILMLISFIGSIAIIRPRDLATLSLIMVTVMALYLIFIVLYLRKVNVIGR